MKQQLRRTDLVWLLAYPLYQLIGTFRHEATHAIVALLQGAVIEEFVFWPTWTDSRFRWGFARWSGDVNWVVTAAPYLCNLATFIIFFVVCTRVRFRRHWVWVNLVAMGLISPLVNSAYNYLNGTRGGGDVASLFRTLPTQVVHAYFVFTLAVYLVGLVLVLKPKSTPGPQASD
jgi:hypothetical protein